jgi:ferredoxin
MSGRGDPAGYRGRSRKWLEVNATYSAEWPNLTRKRESPADADEHKGEEGKFDKYFSANPGQGD